MFHARTAVSHTVSVIFILLSHIFLVARIRALPK
jgi:hypothetical protein